MASAEDLRDLAGGHALEEQVHRAPLLIRRHESRLPSRCGFLLHLLVLVLLHRHGRDAVGRLSADERRVRTQPLAPNP